MTLSVAFRLANGWLNSDCILAGWCRAAVSRECQESQLRRGDDTQLRQRRSAESIACDDGTRDRPQHRLTGSLRLFVRLSVCFSLQRWSLTLYCMTRIYRVV